MNVEKYDLFLDLLTEGFWDWNLKTDLAFLSPRYCELIGYSPKDTVFNSAFLRGLIHPDDQKQVFRMFEEFVQGKSDIFHIECRLISKDGKFLWLEGKCRIAERDKSGRPSRMVGTVLDITGSKQVKEELQRKEELYRQFASLTSDYIYMCKRSGSEPFRIQWMAGAVEAITGYSQDEIFAKGCWLPFVVPEDRERVADCLLAMKAGEIVSIDFKIHTKSGEARWIHETSRCETGEEPGQLLLYGTSQDITDQKMAEIALKENELFLREAQRVAQLGIYQYNIAKDYWNSSKEMDSIFGIAEAYRRDFNGWLMIVHPDYRKKIKNYFKSILASRQLFDIEYKIVRPADNQERWVHGTGELTFDSDGNPLRLIGTIQDITERKLIEEKLKTSEEKFRSITALSPDIISIINVDGVLAYNSPAVYAIHGYTEEELQGRNTFELIHPEDRDHVTDALSSILANPLEIGSVQFRYRHKDGTYTWMEATGSNQLNNPLIKGIVTISRDITYRKELEDQRLNMERDILHAQKLESLGILAGGIAHDFNNLLTAILGNLDLALSRLPACSPVSANIEKSMVASRRAADLTRQMLAFSGKGLFALKPLDLNEIVTGNGELFRAVIPKSITMNVHADVDLPRVMADPGQIQQVVMNLITNAADAIGAKAGVITLSTGTVDCDYSCIQKSVLGMCQ